MAEKTCAYCDQPITHRLNIKKRRFCGDACKNAFYALRKYVARRVAA